MSKTMKAPDGEAVPQIVQARRCHTLLRGETETWDEGMEGLRDGIAADRSP